MLYGSNVVGLFCTLILFQTFINLICTASWLTANNPYFSSMDLILILSLSQCCVGHVSHKENWLNIEFAYPNLGFLHRRYNFLSAVSNS